MSAGQSPRAQLSAIHLAFDLSPLQAGRLLEELRSAQLIAQALDRPIFNKHMLKHALDHYGLSGWAEVLSRELRQEVDYLRYVNVPNPKMTGVQVDHGILYVGLRSSA